MTRARKLIRFVGSTIPLIAIFISGADLAQAQEQAPEQIESFACPTPPKLRHVLNGHGLLPSFAILSPIADSQSTVSLGFGYGTFSSSILGFNNELKLGAFEPSVIGQVMVTPGLAINFGMTGNLIIGLNTQSAIDYGASTSYAFVIGALYEMIRTDSDVFSGGLQFARPHSLAVSPLDAAGAGLQTLTGIGDPNFVANKVTTRWVPNIRYGHGFGSFFGIQSFLGVRLDNTTLNDAESSLKALATFGIGLSSDFKGWIGVPIGLTANYHRNQIISTNESNSDEFTVGAFETISDAFNAGLEFGVAKTSSGHTSIGSVTIRTYYN